MKLIMMTVSGRFAPKSIRPQSFRPQVDSPQVVSPPSHYMSICICKNTPKLIEYPKKLFSKIYELQTNKLAHICEYCGQMDQTATAQKSKTYSPGRLYILHNLRTI
jgi:hypothetical protein